jgi:hypothetical protein
MQPDKKIKKNLTATYTSFRSAANESTCTLLPKRRALFPTRRIRRDADSDDEIISIDDLAKLAPAQKRARSK